MTALAWLTAKTLFGAPRWLFGLALVALLIGGLMIWQNGHDKANQNLGATQQRETDLREVTKRTEEGNAAREEIRAPTRAGDCVRFAQCVRSSRPSAAANCKRFLPEQSTDTSCPGT